MSPPTVNELLASDLIQLALEEAWTDSLVDDPTRRHEEGGWIYADQSTGNLSIRRSPAGGRAFLDLNSPPIIAGSVVVATFHTHPNPSSEGWETGPSDADTRSAWLVGVPCLIRADDGLHTTGPDTRRGGFSGGPGYPP